MPNSYDPQKDGAASLARGSCSPGGVAARLMPNDVDDLVIYPKALRVYVPSSLGEATLKVTPLMAADDAATVTLKFPAGLFYEPLGIRKLFATGTTAGIEIHGYTV